MNRSRSTFFVIAWSFPVGCAAGWETDWQPPSPRASKPQADDRAYDVVLIGVQHCKNISSLWNLLMSIEITRGSINSAESHFKNLSLYCKRDFYFYLSEIHLNCVKGNFGEAKRSFQDFLKNFPDEESALLEFLNAFEANCIK
jgi:hypothetical protein